MDGANKFKQILHITLPCISPTIVTLFLITLGNIMSVGQLNFERVFLLQNPVIYDTADVISTFVYRQGIKSGNYSYGTAIDLFNSVVNVFFLIGANLVAKRVNETSLW
jgi:putative aldouronate transport system permease protein